MSMQTINGISVEVVIIEVDGTTDPTATLQPGELAAVEAVVAVLQANDQFNAAYPVARLERVESNRGVAEHRQGRFYLRYRHTAGVTEFWGHVSREPTFNFKKGVVGVVASGTPTNYETTGSG